MTRLHRKVPDRLRIARDRVRRLKAEEAVRAAAAPLDGAGDLSGLILYGQA